MKHLLLLLKKLPNKKLFSKKRSSFDNYTPDENDDSWEKKLFQTSSN